MKSNAESARESMARRRERAREAGLCVTCCKRQSVALRTLCISCNTAKTDRQRRRRERERKVAGFQEVIAMQEHAGDMASAYHLYADATRHYQQALKVPALTLTDRERIAEKIGQAFFLNGDLQPANRWFKRLLKMYRSDPSEAEKSIETLLQMHRKQIYDCKGEAMLSTIVRAVRIAEISGSDRLLKVTQLVRIETLWSLCRYDEAARVLREVGDIGMDADAVTRGHYFTTRGMVAGAANDAEKVHEYFEAAIEVTKKDVDPYRVAIIWFRYGMIMNDFGDGLGAKTCYERSLFIALQYRITWVIARVRLFYARLLASMGQLSSAHSYLLEALASDPSVPWVDLHRASVGIPLALHFRDTEALEKCAQPRAIEFAFQSEMPDMIGNVCGAFAQLYVSQGRPRAARILLHRALERMTDARLGLDALIAVARYGASSDVLRGRTLLATRAALPHARLFRAGLDLFDAYVAHRKGALVQARASAKSAVAHFEELQLYGYAQVARSIVPGEDAAISQIAIESTPFSHMQPALTAREREVAALVLRGLTNREIARELSIALHTVEKHMNAIMSRLGVRSRYQVADILESSLK